MEDCASLHYENLFDHGFAVDERFADVVIDHVASGKQYKCHRLILAHRSEFFRRLFCSAFKESRGDIIQVQFEDAFDVFPKVLEFLYTGKVDIPLSKIVPLRIAADQFQITELSSVILEYLDKNLTVDNAFRVLEQSLRCTDDLILQRTAEFVSVNFLLLADQFAQVAMDLPAEIFFAIIAHENLGKVKPETIIDRRDTSTHTRPPGVLDHEHGNHEHLSDQKSRNVVVSAIVNRYIANREETVELIRMAIDALLRSDSLTSEDAMRYLAFAEKNEMQDQIRGCARVLAANFHVLLLTANHFILSMSSTSFKELLRCDDLFIKSENQVYDIACEYINRNSRLPDDEKREIMACVRFTFLSLNRLRDIKDRVLRDDTWYISKDTILDALWARVFRMECQSLEFADDAIHQMKPQYVLDEISINAHSLRPRTTRVFNYSSDFDNHGILFWLGTAYGTEKYINPQLRSLVTVSHSSKLESGKSHDLISHTPCSCNLLNQANSTVTVEFKTTSIMPTKYSLRHTNSRDAECLRNWKLQASSNGLEWVDLRNHVNDISLNGKASSHSWDIDQQDEYYNWFRVIQTGNNSSSNTYLSMAGFELYGMVKKLDTCSK